MEVTVYGENKMHHNMADNLQIYTTTHTQTNIRGTAIWQIILWIHTQRCLTICISVDLAVYQIFNLSCSQGD